MDKVKVQLQECADKLDQQEEIAAQFKQEMYNFAAKWQVVCLVRNFPFQFLFLL